MTSEGVAEALAITWFRICSASIWFFISRLISRLPPRQSSRNKIRIVQYHYSSFAKSAQYDHRFRPSLALLERRHYRASLGLPKVFELISLQVFHIFLSRLSFVPDL